MALAVVLGFAIAFVVRSWDDVAAGMGRLSTGSLLASFVFAVGGLGASAAAWRATLAALGSRLSLPAAARVYYLGQLGKYIPGSVWPIVAQAELSREYDVPRSRAALSALVQMLLSVVVGGVVAAAALAAADLVPAVPYGVLLGVAVAGAVLLVPAVFSRLLALAARVLRRGAPEPIASRPLAAAVGWVGVMWLMFGLHLWALARAHAVDDLRLVVGCVGVFALAWVAGFLVVLVPAGAGAREAALVLSIAPLVAHGDALSIALVSRVLMLVGDFALAGAGVAAEKRRRPAPAVAVNDGTAAP
ncbi:lysylphosphatidylglycerol synthase domain-containing protein [Cellulomonas sp.]|uniref:lysylphosphatidylglycerol synthase domain-containing protein n=1 Tax=Cellulomonas sp. TaxID=40001 RepID=UPI002811AF3A|nr:lysylphosphatidylglycerol synthase domain-containing protein [Cellulomonas sp.]